MIEKKTNERSVHKYDLVVDKQSRKICFILPTSVTPPSSSMEHLLGMLVMYGLLLGVWYLHVLVLGAWQLCDLALGE